MMTGPQLAQLAFRTQATARGRLALLTQLGFVERGRPVVGLGSAPWHYLLTAAGAAVLQADDDTINRDDPTGAGQPDHAYLRLLTAARQLTRVTSQHRTHHTGTNSVFTALAWHARTHPGAALTTWVHQYDCWTWLETVRPDGFGIWVEPDAYTEFFLEYDLSTERHHNLTDKIRRYTRAATTITPPIPWVLISFASRNRETLIRATLNDTLAVLIGDGLRPPPVATATLPTATTHHPSAADACPAGPHWRPLARSVEATMRGEGTAGLTEPLPLRALGPLAGQYAADPDRPDTEPANPAHAPSWPPQPHSSPPRSVTDPRPDHPDAAWPVDIPVYSHRTNDQYTDDPALAHALTGRRPTATCCQPH